MTSMKRHHVAAACLGLAAASVLAVGSGPVRAHAATGLVGPFVTSGTQIHDNNGNPVVFKGVDWDGMQESSSSEFMPTKDMDQAVTWGANLVRVELNEEFWNGTCPLDPLGM